MNKMSKMSNKFSKTNIKDTYINTCRNENREVIISLYENSYEQGFILAFDEETIAIRNNEQFEILIEKSAIIKIRTVKRSFIIFNKDKNNNGNNSNGSCCFTKYDSKNGFVDYGDNPKLPNSNNHLRLKDAYKEYVNSLTNFSVDLYLPNDKNENE